MFTTGRKDQSSLQPTLKEGGKEGKCASYLPTTLPTACETQKRSSSRQMDTVHYGVLLLSVQAGWLAGYAAEESSGFPV